MIKTTPCQLYVQESRNEESLHKDEFALIVIDSDGRKFEVSKLQPIKR
jgi:hypothetical protein